MRTLLTAAAVVAACAFGSQAAFAQSKKIDLQTKEGVAAVKGEWRYHDVKIVEVDGKGPDGKPNKTYNIEPKAFGAEFDDSKWEVIEPETLKNARSTGQICFCWYRIKVTIPPKPPGSPSSSRPRSTITERSGSTASCRGHPARAAKPSWRVSTPPIASSSKTPSRVRSTRSPSSPSTDRSRRPRPTGSS